MNIDLVYSIDTTGAVRVLSRWNLEPPPGRVINDVRPPDTDRRREQSVDEKATSQLNEIPNDTAPESNLVLPTSTTEDHGREARLDAKKTNANEGEEGSSSFSLRAQRTWNYDFPESWFDPEKPESRKADARAFEELLRRLRPGGSSLLGTL